MINENKNRSFGLFVRNLFWGEVCIINACKEKYFNQEEVDLFKCTFQELDADPNAIPKPDADRRVINRMKQRMIKALKDHDMDEREHEIEEWLHVEAKPENLKQFRKVLKRHTSNLSRIKTFPGLLLLIDKFLQASLRYSDIKNSELGRQWKKTIKHAQRNNDEALYLVEEFKGQQIKGTSIVKAIDKFLGRETLVDGIRFELMLLKGACFHFAADYQKSIDVYEELFKAMKQGQMYSNYNLGLVMNNLSMNYHHLIRHSELYDREALKYTGPSSWFVKMARFARFLKCNWFKKAEKLYAEISTFDWDSLPEDAHIIFLVNRTEYALKQGNLQAAKSTNNMLLDMTNEHHVKPQNGKINEHRMRILAGEEDWEGIVKQWESPVNQKKIVAHSPLLKGRLLLPEVLYKIAQCHLDSTISGKVLDHLTSMIEANMKTVRFSEYCQLSDGFLAIARHLPSINIKYRNRFEKLSKQIEIQLNEGDICRSPAHAL